jgi:8-oxo-dGTP pyrophosphatase MutT (NUDIX family)
LSRLEGTRPPREPDAEARAVFGDVVSAALFPQPLVASAVLLPLADRTSGLTVILTRRTDHLRDHPGQISFPGGRVDEGDAGPLQAALREAREEIGLPPEAVQVAGYLPAQPVITGFAIVPVVGFIPADVVWRLDPFEVAGIIEVPLEFLLDPTNALRATRRVAPGIDIATVEFFYEGHRIWGATANIIKSFIDTLG